MTEEKGNTIQFTISTSSTDLQNLNKLVNDAVCNLFYESESLSGEFKVTIEFYPDTEDEVEDE